MGREILAALAAVLTVSYGFVFLPLLYHQAGAPFEGLVAACLLVSALGTFLASYFSAPVLVAPSIAVSVWLVYIPVLSRGMSWQQLLLLFLACSLLALLLSLFTRGKAFFAELPPCFRTGLAAGIGLLLLFTGLSLGGLLVIDPITQLTLGDLKNPLAMDSLLGLILLLALRAANVRAAVPLSMLFVGGCSLLEGFWIIPAAPFSLPEGLDRTALQFLLATGWETLPLGDVVNLAFFLLLFLLLEVRGSQEALCAEASPEKKRRGRRALYGVSLLGAIFGAPPLSFAPETAAARQLGLSRRSGLLAAGLLLLLLFLTPTLRELASFPAMLAPGLAGAALSLLERVRFSGFDFSEGVTAGLLMLLLPLTRNIALSLGLGFLAFAFLKVMAGKQAEVPLLLRILAAASLLYAVYGYWSLLL